MITNDIYISAIKELVKENEKLKRDIVKLNNQLNKCNIKYLDDKVVELVLPAGDNFDLIIKFIYNFLKR